MREEPRIEKVITRARVVLFMAATSEARIEEVAEDWMAAIELEAWTWASVRLAVIQQVSEELKMEEYWGKEEYMP